MRTRLINPQLVTVRVLVPKDPDSFGDTSVEPSRRSISIRMQVQWFTGKSSEPGLPGRDQQLIASGKVTRSDADERSWEPKADDIVELSDGRSLFIRDVQPDDALPIRIGRPNGGFGAYRLMFASSEPSQRAASVYG